MKSTTISLMLAFSTMLGLAACGPAQVDPSEAPEIGENTAALSCPPAIAGYYYCPAYPENRHYFLPYIPECHIQLEETGPFVRTVCNDTCDTPCVHVGL